MPEAKPPTPSPLRSKSQSEYAKQYKISIPTVKRLWKNTRLPWDVEGFMRDFLKERVQKKREALLNNYWALQEKKDPASGGAAGALDLPDDFAEGQGLRRELHALEEACKAARADWAAKERAGLFELANRSLGRWHSLMTLFRQFAKDAPATLKSLEESLDKSEVESTWGQIFSTIRRQLDNLPRRASRNLVGLKAEQIEERLEAEVEIIRQALEEGNPDEQSG
jgi:hypothetical protein